MEDPRNKEERAANLSYEQLMAKKTKEAQKAEKNRIQAQSGKLEKIVMKEKKEKKEPLVELESIKIGKAP